MWCSCIRRVILIDPTVHRRKHLVSVSGKKSKGYLLYSTDIHEVVRLVAIVMYVPLWWT